MASFTGKTIVVEEKEPAVLTLNHIPVAKLFTRFMTKT
jgi:hypothetical protein